MNFAKLLKSEKTNPDLQSDIDINELLRASDNVDIDSLGKQSLAEISKEIVQALHYHNIPESEIPDICSKLGGYRLVDQVYKLQLRHTVRWIRLFKNGERLPFDKLHRGGFLSEIKFLDGGTHLLVKIYTRFAQLPFDDCLFFQRFTDDEQMVLGCYELLRKL